MGRERVAQLEFTRRCRGCGAGKAELWTMGCVPGRGVLMLKAVEIRCAGQGSAEKTQRCGKARDGVVSAAHVEKR